MKRRKLAPLVVAALRAAGCFAVLAAADAAAMNDLRQGLVVDVVDGDTLKIVGSGQRIRLFGVDACETGQKAHSPLGQSIDCGVDAKAALISWTAGQKIECRISGQDRYHRLLGVCRNGQIQDFGGELVRRGFAVAYRFHRRPVDEKYARMEQRARQQKQGLWRFEFQQPWTWRRKHSDHF